MRPGNPKGWGKGKSKGINGMEYGSEAFPPVLGAVMNDGGYYEQQQEDEGWWSQEQEG